MNATSLRVLEVRAAGIIVSQPSLHKTFIGTISSHMTANAVRRRMQIPRYLAGPNSFVLDVLLFLAASGRSKRLVHAYISKRLNLHYVNRSLSREQLDLHLTVEQEVVSFTGPTLRSGLR